jgi:hypothetical protein
MSARLVGLVAAVALWMPTPAAALTQRTFVASYGQDASPTCSAPAPCRSFAQALTRTADKGEIIVIDSGGYGPVIISQSVSIIAPPGVYAGVTVGIALDGVTIDAPGVNVVLRGLSLNGQGGRYGIWFKNGASVLVDRCTVANMNNLGVYHGVVGGTMVVSDSIVRDNASTGIGVGVPFLQTGAYLTLDHVRVDHNAGSGVGVGIGAFASIRNSIVVDNGAVGIGGSGGQSITMSLAIDRTLVSGNATEGIIIVGAGPSSATAQVNVAGSTIVGNGTGIFLDDEGAPVLATVTGSTIANNAGDGIRTAFGASAHVGGNVLSGNGGTALLQSGIYSMLKSRVDNSVEVIPPAVAVGGTITTLPTF